MYSAHKLYTIKSEITVELLVLAKVVGKNTFATFLSDLLYMKTSCHGEQPGCTRLQMTINTWQMQSNIINPGQRGASLGTTKTLEIWLLYNPLTYTLFYLKPDLLKYR